MIDKLKKAEERFEKIEESLADPEIFTRQEEFTALMKERKNLLPVIENSASTKPPRRRATTLRSCATTPRSKASCAKWRRRNSTPKTKTAQGCSTS